MNKTFRLHRQHDLDLIALYRSKGFNFARELKKALIAYANGYEYVAPSFEDDFSKGYVATSVTFHISLSESNPEQKKALDLLEDVRYGYRNSFVKAVFRSYLSPLPLSAFSKENGLITRRGIPSSVIKEESTNEIKENNKTFASEEKKSIHTDTSIYTDDTQKNDVVDDVIAQNNTNDTSVDTSVEDMSSLMASLGALSHS